ncbi:MAG: citrate/2-methylcitrate synthase [Syntrophomonadaceae bacterium]|nr:citrate/2-methylcitrate synthase [Syntrophomonadaceae bacterium]MDD3022494.1 citrate/2-methylcitrate synthase [Syntrophomonadaceae bacterium]
MAEQSSFIEEELFIKYNVKRGLRDLDGRGVLVGLTEIGEVHSYILDENEIVPVPGRLMYRGIDIKDIVDGFLNDDRFGFEETCYLLLFGRLPDNNQLNDFVKLLTDYQKLPEYFARDMILRAPSKNIMNLLARSVLALYSFDEAPDNTSIQNVLKQCLRLIAWFPSLAVYAYQAFSHYFDDNSLVLHSPRCDLSIAENILHMLRLDSNYTRLEAKLLDLALVLHAEHGGGNNSSFVTHVVTSSGTDTYGVVAAALGALKGPRHGGANHKVVQMFEDMKKSINDWEDEEEIKSYLMKLLNCEAFDKAGLIYGIGHAVYSISDPRAVLLKEQAAKLALEKGMEDEFKLYSKVERLAPEVIKSERKIYKGVSANVDFYSGLVYRMLDIPCELFTPLFAVARIVGWSAHRIEEIVNDGKIVRPAYKSVSNRQKYIPMKGR